MHAIKFQTSGRGAKVGRTTHHDRFVNFRLHLEPVNRGCLTDEWALQIVDKELNIQRLELVGDIFIFSCFTGLAYIDEANLTPDRFVMLGDKEWIMDKRQKTCVKINILLLDIPKRIISISSDRTHRDGKLIPILSNQTTNSARKRFKNIVSAR